MSGVSGNLFWSKNALIVTRVFCRFRFPVHKKREVEALTRAVDSLAALEDTDSYREQLSRDQSEFRASYTLHQTINVKITVSCFENENDSSKIGFDSLSLSIARYN